MDEGVKRRIQEKRSMAANSLGQAIESVWEWYVLEKENEGEQEAVGRIHSNLVALHDSISMVSWQEKKLVDDKS